MMPVINQLWPAGPADTRMHDRPARPTAFCWNQKYPRICGEKAAAESAKRAEQGSPPHMQGKGDIKIINVHVARITPAYAGKSEDDLRYCQTCWDHPRICGEKESGLNGKGRTLGSPPHMRGKGI